MHLLLLTKRLSYFTYLLRRALVLTIVMLPPSVSLARASGVSSIAAAVPDEAVTEILPAPVENIVSGPASSAVKSSSEVISSTLPAFNPAEASLTQTSEWKVAQLTPDAPPAAFGIAGEAAAEGDGREIELAAGRLRLTLAHAAPGAILRYQPVAAEETGSPFGVGFELSTEQGERLSPASAITLTLDYRDLAIPYRAAAESRLGLFMAQPIAAFSAEQDLVEPGAMVWQRCPARWTWLARP